jgi:hypothetical protein
VVKLRDLRQGAALLAFSLYSGCTTLVIPPAAPTDPRPVFLLDHGRHASLVLPADDSTVVRYSYGDWQYYARRETGVIEASTAVLWPTRAGLGRREHAGPPDSATVERRIRVGIERLHQIATAADDIRRLRLHLDSIFEANVGSRIYNSAYDLEFVHHPRAYWVFHSSNQVVAQWLAQLGCSVHGLALFSRWRVQPPRQDQ